MDEYNLEGADFGLDPKEESKRQKHIIIIFTAVLISVVLGIFIFNMLNVGEVSLAKDYVKEHYGDTYNYVSSKAIYSGVGCVASPKESVTVIFQGNDFSVITVTIKGGVAYE